MESSIWIMEEIFGQPLEPPEVESAVDVDDVAGGEGEVALEDGLDGEADVVRGAPPVLRDEAVGEHFVVFVLHAGGHVGGHDAGAEFEDLDAGVGEADGPELRGHGEAGLGDAVFAAVDRGGVGREGSDEEELVAAGEAGLAGVGEPVAGGELGEEVGALEIDADDFVEDFLGGFGDVGADAGGDAGVVDEGVEVAVGGERGVEEALAVGGESDVSTDEGEFLFRVGREFSAGEGGGFGGFLVAGVMDGHGKSGLGEGFGDAAAQAAGGAGDEDDGGRGGHSLLSRVGLGA
jgi:hypothetical protein